jgi:glycosyltransferase involved in cell wall biosynthesis
MKKVKLSVIIPAYNEKGTILSILKKVENADIGKNTKEIIIVDDFSKDGTRNILKKLKKIKRNAKNIKYKILFHEKNYGKGHAIKTGLKSATGDIILIQDADLEYDPKDYKNLIEPIISGKAKVVYGSRRLNKKNKQYSKLSFMLGGIVITWVTNILFLIHITDEPTCYKVFKADVIKKIKINGEKFEWEPEITAKIAKQRIRIYEVPIKYYPRSPEEGKKIKWKDGLEAIWTLIKYRFVN